MPGGVLACVALSGADFVMSDWGAAHDAGYAALVSMSASWPLPTGESSDARSV
jgi:hypothetical protein